MPLAERRVAIDAEVERTRQAFAEVGEPVSCGGLGCWGCCRGAVTVMRDEYRDIVAHAPQEALQRARAGAAAYNDQKRSTRALCPLLDPRTMACSVYEHRPLVCRAHMAVTPRAWCWPERVGDRDVATAAWPQALVVALFNAAVHRDGRGAIMPLATSLAREPAITKGSEEEQP